MNAGDCPRVYVACLASYNAGVLYGKWIDADQDAEVIREEIAGMLEGSPTRSAEEYAIHDHDGFHPYELGEYESIDRVAELGRGIVEHGRVFPTLVDHLGDLEDAVRAMRDAYLGEWNSLEDYVEDCYRSCHEVPDNLEYYVDWNGMARDWEMSGDIYSLELDGNVHVFSNH